MRSLVMVDQNTPYTRRKSTLPKLPANDTHGLQEPSPITGELIEWEMLVLPSNEIPAKTIKSQYNKRSKKHLTRAAVNDILPEISELKRNTQYVKAVEIGGKYEILEGVRRTTAVSYVPDGKLYMLVAKSLSEEEKRHYAQMSDVYREPTQLDIGYSALEIREQYKQQGDVIRDFKLAEMFAVSTGKMSEAIASASLPDSLILLFPALEFIQVRFLRQVIAWIKVNELDKFGEVIKRFEQLSEDDKNIQRESVTLQKKILKELAASVAKEVEFSPATTLFTHIDVIDGIGLSVKPTGEVLLSIDTNELGDEYLELMRELISKKNN